MLLIEEEFSQLITIGQTLQTRVHEASVAQVGKPDNSVLRVDTLLCVFRLELVIVLRRTVLNMEGAVSLHARFVAVGDAIALAGDFEDL